MGEVSLSKDLLAKAGGWAEFKKARALHEGGEVKETEYVDGELRGMVRVGGKTKRVRMVVRSETDLENFCGCLTARREGRICAHALALALEILEPRAVSAESEKKEERDEWPLVSEEGVPVELSVMLPLRVGEGWKRGALMVGFGLGKNNEEGLLAEIGDEAVSLRDEDEDLWWVLRDLFPGKPPGVVNLGRGDFLTLLEGLAGHGETWFGKKSRAVVRGRSDLRGRVVRRRERLGVSWPGGGEVFCEGGRAWLLNGEVFLPLVLGLPEDLSGVMGDGLVVDAVEGRAILSRLEEWFEIEEAILRGLPERAEPEVEVRLEGSLRHLEARVVFSYGGIESGPGEARIVEGLLTNSEAEREVIEELRAWGFSEVNRGGVMELREREEILRFHAFGLDEIASRWPVTKGDRFRAAAKQVVAVRPRLEYRGSGEDWFSVGLRYEAGGEELGAGEVARLLRMGKGEAARAGGKIAVFDRERLEGAAEMLSDCDPRQEGGAFRISAAQRRYFEGAAGELGVAKEGWPEEKVAELGGRLEGLEKVLRPYQREGVEWLWGLSALGMGGILADDMGLGKTLQALAFLKARGGKALVVCPASLVENWAAESRKFTPGREVAVIYGPGRDAQRAKAAEADLWVTSYALLRLDADKWGEFDTVILDEAQQIRNPDSQVSKAAFLLEIGDPGGSDGDSD